MLGSEAGSLSKNLLICSRFRKMPLMPQNFCLDQLTFEQLYPHGLPLLLFFLILFHVVPLKQVLLAYKMFKDVKQGVDLLKDVQLDENFLNKFSDL